MPPIANCYCDAGFALDVWVPEAAGFVRFFIVIHLP